MRKKSQKSTNVSRSRNLAIATVFAALYAALVIGFAPLSSLPIQVRVADVLMPLVILLGWPVIIGLGIGTVIGNFGADSLLGLPSGSIGLDIVGGSLVNILVGYLAWKIGQRNWRVKSWNASWFAATLVETGLISIVVGSYLSVIFPPVAIGFSILGVLSGEIVAVNIGGFILLRIIGRRKTLDLFRSWGFETYPTDPPR